MEFYHLVILFILSTINFHHIFQEKKSLNLMQFGLWIDHIWRQVSMATTQIHHEREYAKAIPKVIYRNIVKKLTIKRVKYVGNTTT
jgi:hypothetical protein